VCVCIDDLWQRVDRSERENNGGEIKTRDTGCVLVSHLNLAFCSKAACLCVQKRND